jgi:metal-responsive CopG/Arc/MetJ family transcriptional regulator
MLIDVRTTVVLEDQLAREAKRLAARRGISLSELVSEALRAALAEPVGPVPRFEMVTYGEGAPAAHHEPRDFAAALEEDDRSSVGH